MKEKYEASKCFIITPIGTDKTDLRRSADGVIHSVIRPILENLFNFKDVKAAHEINSTGSINNQIMNRIIDDDLVIANLTGVNPNVMYEVAVRHATMKPIIHICEEGTKLPFDIIDQRTIFYKNDMLGVQELSQNLKNMIEDALKSTEHKDNPIYNATKTKIYQDTIINNPEKSFEKYLLERFDRLESKFFGQLTNKSIESKCKENEKFEIKLKVPKDIDKEVLYVEFKSVIEKFYIELSMFKIMKEEEIEQYKIFYILISIGNNAEIPWTDQVQKCINTMKYSSVEVIAIEGNELPF